MLSTDIVEEGRDLDAFVLIEDRVTCLVKQVFEVGVSMLEADFGAFSAGLVCGEEYGK